MINDFSVGNGWWPILAATIDDAARFPDEWCFELTGATRRKGALHLEAQFHSPDVSVGNTEPHPFKAFIELRERARILSLVTCEICGQVGRLRECQILSARVRCESHADIFLAP